MSSMRGLDPLTGLCDMSFVIICKKERADASFRLRRFPSGPLIYVLSVVLDRIHQCKQSMP